MGVEREHRDARFVYAEVGCERVGETLYAVDDLLAGDVGRDGGQRLVNGHERYPEAFAGHDHHGFVAALAQTGFEKLGVAGEVELVAMDGIFGDRTGDKHVDEALLEVAHGLLEGGQSGLARGG